MSLYSNYPLDSTRYLNIVSTSRNRNLFPYSTEFDINLPNNKAREGKDENTGVHAVDPVYDGYPLEFGYFGSCSNDATNYPNGLQLSNLASDSSNFYSRLIVQDETVYPRDYATIISYDSTTATTGYSKSAIISGWVKGTANTGNPGSLYSIRRGLPLAQGSCWVMPNPSQVNLVNTGGMAVDFIENKTGLNSFENDYNTDIDYMSIPIINIHVFLDYHPPSYGPCMVGILNKRTGVMSNALISGYKNGNSVMWKPNTRFFVGNIIYTVIGGTPHYYTVIKGGVSGNKEPTSVSLDTVLNDPIEIVATGVQYVYKGTSYPLRKRWLPATHYSIGDIIGAYGLTYTVTATAGLGLTSADGNSLANPCLFQLYCPYGVFTSGDLTLSRTYWITTDPGFGYLFSYPGSAQTTPTYLNNFAITFSWVPNTYMAEGTFGVCEAYPHVRGIPYAFCVYKAGISGSTVPDFSSVVDYGIIKDGTAYLMLRLLYIVLPKDVAYESKCSVIAVNMPPHPDDPPMEVYVGQTFSLFLDANVYKVVKGGLFGTSFPGIVYNYNSSTNTYSCIGGTAIFERVDTPNIDPYTYSQLRLTPFPRPPNIKNPKPFTNRYNVIPWSANSAFSTGEYLYYGTLTFDVIQGGTTGDIPPTDAYNQTNGTVILSKLSYTDPYKGCLLKITQVEDNDNQFKPYYARISYYNPNTNIVHLESPLPITEKRCLYEILQFSRDNYNPLEFTFSPFFSNISTPKIFYDISLISLDIPNLPVYSANNVNVLTSSQPQPFDSYPKLGSFPFIVVTLRNTKNSTQSIPICSNNPSEYKSTFRIPVSDPNPNLTSPFTRLYGNETVTMYLNPQDNLRFTITDPDGNLIVFANPLFFTEFIEFVKNNTVFPDTIRYIGGNKPGFGLGWVMGDLLPIPPSLTGQVSVCFSIRPRV